MAKNKRDTIGRRLKRARDKVELSALQVAQRADLAETTVLQYEKDIFVNPGLKTVERIALGLGLDPLEVISLGLDTPPQFQNGFKASRFAHLWAKYQRLSKEQRPFWDELIEMLIRNMEHK